MKTRFSLFAILLFPAAFISAQSAFLKNADIVWAAEIEQDWVVDIPSLEDEWDEGILTLKLLRTEKNEAYWSSPFLADLVFQSALKGAFPVFKDARCQIPADIFKVYPDRDTVVTFDPETYEEKKQIWYVEPEPFYDFQAWRLRQVLAYNSKTASWSTTVEAIAPLVKIKNAAGDSIGLRPLLWFRPDNKRPKLASTDIVWAKKTRNRQAKTRVLADQKALVKVSDGFQNPLVHLFKVLETNKKIPFYDSSNEKKLDPAERRKLIYAVDTIVSFDPETYEEQISIVHNEINLANIRELRLVQSWYWDERRHRLSICLDAAGPLEDVLDDRGEIRFSRPIFYRH